MLASPGPQRLAVHRPRPAYPQAWKNYAAQLKECGVSAAPDNPADLSVSVTETIRVKERPLLSLGPVAVHTADSPSLTIERRAGRRLPEITARINRVGWDFMMITGGAGTGAIVGGKPGAVVGAGVCYAWGRWFWRQEQD